ncbi:hypothetical protein D3C80_1686980 [compost metagenome]
MQARQAATEFEEVTGGVQAERPAVELRGDVVAKAQVAVVEFAVTRPIAAAQPVVATLPAPALADAIDLLAAFEVEGVEFVGQAPLF